MRQFWSCYQRFAYDYLQFRIFLSHSCTISNFYKKNWNVSVVISDLNEALTGKEMRQQPTAKVLFNSVNRSWRISTSHNSIQRNQIFTIFKIIQQSNMVPLSCLAKKNRTWGKKSSVYFWKLRFQARNALKTSIFSDKLIFFPQVEILIFLCEAT